MRMKTQHHHILSDLMPSGSLWWIYKTSCLDGDISCNCQRSCPACLHLSIRSKQQQQDVCLCGALDASQMPPYVIDHVGCIILYPSKESVYYVGSCSSWEPNPT